MWCMLGIPFPISGVNFTHCWRPHHGPLNCPHSWHYFTEKFEKLQIKSFWLLKKSKQCETISVLMCTGLGWHIKGRGTTKIPSLLLYMNTCTVCVYSMNVWVWISTDITLMNSLLTHSKPKYKELTYMSFFSSYSYSINRSIHILNTYCIQEPFPPNFLFSAKLH